MKELQLIYRKRKQQLLPLIFGFASIFILFRIVLPQWTDIQNVLQLITTKNSTIKAKEASVLLLNSLPTEGVDADFNSITTALPLQKDIILIFEELNNAASETDVDLGGFSVKVGGIYSAASGQQKKEKAVTGVPYLNILVSVSGENAKVRLFAKKLYQSMPLVEIESLDVGRNDARYEVKFYYKPVSIRPTKADTVALEPLTNTEIETLKTLRSWQSSSSLQ